jgi:hypothetical protein
MMMGKTLLISLSLGACLAVAACGGSSSTTGSGTTGTTTGSGGATTGTGGASTTTGTGGASTTTGTGGASTTTGTGGASTTTGTGGGSVDPEVDAACTAFATVRCQKLDACTNDTGVKIRFGTQATCVARYKLTCIKGLEAAGTGATIASTNACAAALPGESCDAFFDGPPVPDCAVPMGSRAANAACITGSQCMSGFCSQDPELACGTCALAPQAGESCAATGDCGYLACGKSSLTCVAYGTAGVACDKDHPCHASLSCVGSGGGVMGTCQLAKTQVGQGCDDAAIIAPDCNHDLGLRCDDLTNKCVVYQYAGAGLACGKLNNGKTICTDGSECVIPKGEVAGFCVAPAEDGGACDTKDGPPCLRPAKCVTGGMGSSGVCKVQDAALCP